MITSPFFWFYLTKYIDVSNILYYIENNKRLNITKRSGGVGIIKEGMANYGCVKRESENQFAGCDQYL